MKKSLQFMLIGGLLIILSSCAQKQKTSQDNPLEAAGNYVPGMVGLNKQAKENIQIATGQENQKLNDALNEDNKNNDNNMDLVKKYTAAIIKTNQGDIKVKFSADSAPKTVENFLKLSQSKFYDGTKFHRVIKGFMIQGGDPLSKDETMKNRWGTGGPGYQFDDEIRGTEKYPQGTLAMANSGPNTNGSQFFIVTASPEAPLPASYTIFGSVVSGLDVALKIENIQTGPSDRPVENVVIQSVEVSER